MKIFSVWVILLFSTQAFGDIVFFDINDNPQEIEAARKAAVKRGEKLIVYPQIKPAERAARSRIVDQMNALRAQYERSASPNEQRRLLNEFFALSDQTTSAGEKVDPRSAKKFVDQLAKDKVNVTGIVISGHDGNGEFTGTQGSLTASDLQEAFAPHEELKNGVKSLFLAGCYTTKPGTLDHQWKPQFPNLEIINGYIDSAPLGDKPAGHEFIYNALSREKEMLAAKGQSQIQATARRIIPAALSTNASICLKDGVYVERAKYLTLEQAYKKCDMMLEKKIEVVKNFNCYAEALEGCEDPPENTRSSPLREHYNLIQDVEHCSFNPKYTDLFEELPSGARMIRLIYYKNVRSNFAALYKNEIESSAAILKKAGLADEDIQKLLRIGSLSRKETIALIRKIEELGRTEVPESDKEKGISILAAELIANSLRGYLLNLSSSCVPFNWVEPNSRERPRCDRMLRLGAAAEKYARENYEKNLVQGRIKEVRRQREEYQREIHSIGDPARGQDPIISQEALDVRLVEARLQIFRSEEDRLQAQVDLSRWEQRIARVEEERSDAETRGAAARVANLDRDLVSLRRDRDALRATLANFPQPSAEFLSHTANRASVQALRSNPERYFSMVSEALTMDSARLEGLRSELARFERLAQEDARRMLAGEISEEQRSQNEDWRNADAHRMRDEIRQSELTRDFVENSRRLHASGNQDQAARLRVQEIVSQRAAVMVRDIESYISILDEDIAYERSRLEDLSPEAPTRSSIENSIHHLMEDRSEHQQRLNQIMTTIGPAGAR